MKANKNMTHRCINHTLYPYTKDNVFFFFLRDEESSMITVMALSKLKVTLEKFSKCKANNNICKYLPTFVFIYSCIYFPFFCWVITQHILMSVK